MTLDEIRSAHIKRIYDLTDEDIAIDDMFVMWMAARIRGGLGAKLTIRIRVN